MDKVTSAKSEEENFRAPRAPKLQGRTEEPRQTSLSLVMPMMVLVGTSMHYCVVPRTMQVTIQGFVGPRGSTEPREVGGAGAGAGICTPLLF